MNKYLRGITSILPALAIASVSIAAHAQSTASQVNSNPDVAPLPFVSMGTTAQELNAARVFNGSMSSQNLDGLRRNNLEVLATVVDVPEKQACFVMASVVSRHHREAGVLRMHPPFQSVATDVNKGEAIEVACERAASKAVSLLIPVKEVVAEDALKNAAAKLDPRQPALKVGKRDMTLVRIASMGTLTEKGGDVAARTLGERWSMVVDNSIMSALVLSMDAKTESGKQVCAAMFGMTPRHPDGRGVLVPDGVKFSSSVVSAGQDCTYDNLTNAMKHLRDNMADFYPDTSKLAEKGVKYPSRAQFMKALAAYDAKAAKEAKAAAAKQAKAAKTSTATSAACNYSCSGTVCERVFDNGRKDVVRVPLKYNHQTKMPEADTWMICMR